MGRLQPSRGLPPAGFRRAARAKKAKATINQLIPSLLSTHPRARRGIDAAELIVFDQETGTSKTNISQTNSPSPRITLVVADTLAAARALTIETPNPEPKPTNPTDTTTNNKPTQESSSPSSSPFDPHHAHHVAILNMASPLTPGGGFLNGATSQEESLCMRTTLLPSLRDHYYRLPDLGAIYTPDVLVFRSEDDTAAAAAAAVDVLDKKDRWFVDCVSAAMPRNPDTEADPSSGRRRYVRDKDRQLVLDKMKMVMRVCRVKGVRRVVLGAWGCGAYGNPVGEVAAAWRKVLLPRTTDGGKGKKKKGGGGGGGGGGSGAVKEDWRDVVEEVVFAVKDAGMADAFAAAFGEGLVREELAGSHGGEDEGGDGEEEGGDQEDDPGQADRAELRARIHELEVRIQASTNPQLKQGLLSILASLVNQLPADEDSDLSGEV
ncbi:hypothetical protein SODALDRAFT_278423 [Sodiomyces alkalinus F11]|uniref:Microbial-type PARG catalytic domain-containing protein n=1 Tax=Sodiomyces alkalinus (strain CBS 110278 / VKM F-3762 / F11) TaxID=1314773 RepID=A0A3N2PU17_SODAK|nr:hypothetical protein SODALDRAFT_278423 [Sodiomyces alkalinus F11]ROT38008.1 hypothetical protein SODALDRAFT_278423 [Sodiomyces alkalinus F11]